MRGVLEQLTETKIRKRTKKIMFRCTYFIWVYIYMASTNACFAFTKKGC